MGTIEVCELSGEAAAALVPLLERLSQDAEDDAHEEMLWDLALDGRYVARGEHDPRKGLMRLYAAYADGEFVGALSLAVDSNEDGLPPDTVVLSRMATTGTVRGAGKRLLEECCRYAAERRQGVVAFALPSARGFYRSQGMSDSRHRRLYRCEFTAAQAAAYASVPA